jgi:predicted DNA-binding helix-hairpin-helix protein
MDTTEKLALLGGAARYEVPDQRQLAYRPRALRSRAARAAPVAGALCLGEAADGRSGTLLRVLQSSRCEHDCAYCPLRRSNDPRRASFAPEELANAFADLHTRGGVDGLLLSSATDGSPDQAMTRMLDTLRILRARHEYTGYIHLKVLPGASRAALEEAAQLADRLSLNVEVPSAAYLGGLETGKRWQEDIVQRLAWLHDLDQAGAIRAGISSQLLVGVAAPDAPGATDRALSEGSRALRHQFGLRRVHFGDFAPAPGTPLEALPAPDPRRRARLYQMEWLATQYDFTDRELDAAFDTVGNLPLGLDPKLALTLARPTERPIEITTATPEELLRVPGIGPVSAGRILEYRALGMLRDLSDLRALGVVTGRAAPFVLLHGRRPVEAAAVLQRLRRQARAAGPRPVQLRLWPEDGPGTT